MVKIDINRKISFICDNCGIKLFTDEIHVIRAFLLFNKSGWSLKFYRNQAFHFCNETCDTTR